VSANIWTHTFFQNGQKIRAHEHEAINYALMRHHTNWYTGGYGITVIDEITNKATKLPGGTGSEIWSMHSMNDSLLILGRTNGFSLFNSKTYRFDSLPATAPASFVYRFFLDKSGAIIAVAENGLFRLHRNPDNHLHNGSQWRMQKMESSFLNGLSLLDAYQDSDGAFWLATNGEGLYRWNPQNNAVKQFNIAAGFPSDVLYRIEPDDFENLWISSDYGLVRFNLRSFLVKTYTILDGLTHNEFNRTSSFKGVDGRLYFGGLNGINAFDPRAFRTDATNLDVPLRVIAFNQFVGTKSELINKTTELLRNPRIVLEPTDFLHTRLSVTGFCSRRRTSLCLSD
jgi:ligand-binding sensor domain-containing protein